MSKVQNAIDAWREETGSPRRVRQAINGIRSIAERSIQRHGVPLAEAEELAQEVTLRIWELLLNGYAQRGSELALLSRMTCNAANQWHRNTRRREVPYESSSVALFQNTLSPTQYLHPYFPSQPQTPEEAYHQEELVGILLQKQAKIQALLHTMPVSPRWVFIRLYVDKRSIPEIVEERINHQLLRKNLSLDLMDEDEEKKFRKTCHNWVTANKKRAIQHLHKNLVKES